MRYKSFRIKNFKGIRDTTIKLQSKAGANVFAFVGLNESGKTTILEAIHSFSPTDATSEVLGGTEDTGVPFAKRVPRHQISDFTGDVSVAATIELTEDERVSIAKTIDAAHKIQVEGQKLPKEILIERHQRFKNGDFERAYFTLRTKFRVKTRQGKIWREMNLIQQDKIKNTIYRKCPDIAYFPTFVFDFPESFYLTDRGTRVDKFYRRVFQDILDFDGRGHKIDKDIVKRVRADDLKIGWADFWGIWARRDDKDKVQHVMDRASATVTELVFGRWNKIFGEDVRGKEIQVSYEIEEGEVENDDGLFEKTEEHDVIVKFQIRDGTNRFSVNDRSLGFRWFFLFMLFTQFRIARTGWFESPILFLFDEPASNLHAAAQQKLLESFPQIAVQDHVLGYSTHSHYMIDPKWLEQTFVVTNRSDAPPNSILDEISLDDESLDIQVRTYRSFVNDNPSQTSYFQPILDRLQVVPSQLDLQKRAIVLEGKSDYYILRYCSRLLKLKDMPLVPGLGAGTFGALAALHVGWNLKFLFLLDGDPKGLEERERYRREFGINDENLIALSDINPSLKKIEALLDEPARGKIAAALDLERQPTKKQILDFFQEGLASDKIVSLGKGFEENARDVLKTLRERLSKL
ncbi:ATP-dependent nuclease [Qipengyuania flava]|uniref:ATP-dependent nuclease n=1 Tax=Qipengyuania flava TaxID=192812 RepID=UPI00273E0E8B|nr:AAA family ATPase [Qipengyuania flava]